MIELKPVFNLKAHILQFLLDRHTGNKFTLTPDDIKILNQEKDGTILYSWNGVTDIEKPNVTTHVGLYETSSNRHRVVWIYNQKIKMVSCSINQERTLLAFTECSTVTDQGKKKGSVYSAFLAELQGNSARVFSLNLETPHFIKMQFLYGEKISTKVSHMLVLIHKESVGLYHIPLGRVGDKGIIMRENPKTEQLARKFVWCQWDALTQRLHYIYYRSHGNRDKEQIQVEPILSSVQFSHNAVYSQMLNIPISGPFPYIRSFGRSHYSHDVLHDGIPDSSVNVRVLVNNNGTFCLCYQHLLSHSHAILEGVRTSVQSPGSSTCSITPRPHRRTSSRHSDGSPVQYELNYYIYIVHHANILHGHVLSFNSEVHPEPKVNFVWLGDYLMVFYPGHFLHLLNVGIEFDLCHHILLQSKSYSHMETEEAQQSNESDSVGNEIHVNGDMEDRTKVKTKYTKDKEMLGHSESILFPEAEKLSQFSAKSIVGVLSVSAKACLLDHKTGILWHPVINTTLIVRVFSQCYTDSTRHAILHYALLRMRDFELIRKLFDVLSNDIVSDEVPVLMAEFLTATTYYRMRQQYDREVCRLLPVTISEAVRGQFEKNENGEWLARISYSSIKDVIVDKKTSKERHQRRWNVTEDFWDALRHHLRLKQHNPTQRFSQKNIHEAYEKIQKEKKSKTSTSAISKNEETIFYIPRKANSTNSRDVPVDPDDHKVHSDSVLKIVPGFLLGNEVTEQSEEILTLSKKLLSSHLIRYLKKESMVKAMKVAKEYAICQIYQSRKLCRLLWSLRGPRLPYTFHGLLPDLREQKCVEENELFQLLERYYMALSRNAFPTPQGFNSYFSALGFRCLDNIVFIQYLDCGVFQLTREFVAEILSDLPDTVEGNKLKYQIVSRLPLKLAEECYRQWNHPVCNRYLAHNQVTEILSGKASSFETEVSCSNIRKDLQQLDSKDSQDGSSTSIAESLSFRPLTAFLNMLEQSASHQLSDMTSPLHASNSLLDVNFLEETALCHTITDSSCDMSTVNF